jgi:hypothetical protein
LTRVPALGILRLVDDKERHMNRIPLAAVLAAALVCVPAAAEAQRRDRPQVSPPTANTTAGFTQAERQLIVQYFSRNRMEVQALPPGIARNLQRGKPMPPGIAKRAIPQGLQASLPPREGVEVSILGDRIVLLEASGLVVDILEGVFK